MARDGAIVVPIARPRCSSSCFFKQPEECESENVHSELINVAKQLLKTFRSSPKSLLIQRSTGPYHHSDRKIVIVVAD